MHLPTNAEIIANEALDNSLLVDIPTTKFCILCEKKEKNRYKVSIISKMGSVKKTLSENMNENKVAVLAHKALRFRDLQHFKKKPTQKQVVNHFKALIKK